VVLGWHHTNTPGPGNDQVTPVIEGGPMGLQARNVALRVGDGDR